MLNIKYFKHFWAGRVSVKCFRPFEKFPFSSRIPFFVCLVRVVKENILILGTFLYKTSICQQARFFYKGISERCHRLQIPLTSGTLLVSDPESLGIGPPWWPVVSGTSSLMAGILWPLTLLWDPGWRPQLGVLAAKCGLYRGKWAHSGGWFSGHGAAREGRSTLAAPPRPAWRRDEEGGGEGEGGGQVPQIIRTNAKYFFPAKLSVLLKPLSPPPTVFHHHKYYHRWIVKMMFANWGRCPTTSPPTLWLSAECLDLGWAFNCQLSSASA